MKRPGTRINFFFFFSSPNLYQEPYATSFATHARTCCEDFCGCRAGEMSRFMSHTAITSKFKMRWYLLCLMRKQPWWLFSFGFKNLMTPRENAL